MLQILAVVYREGITAGRNHGCDRFLQFNFSVFSLVLVSRQKIYQTLKTVTTFPNTLNFFNNTPLRVLFSTRFSVFGNVVRDDLSCLIRYFSNSLIIHQVHTKEIMTVTMFGYLPRFLRFYLSVFSLVLVSIEKIYQTLESVFHRLSKHLQFRQKYSAASRIFNSLLPMKHCLSCLMYYFSVFGNVIFLV